MSPVVSRAFEVVAEEFRTVAERQQWRGDQEDREARGHRDSGDRMGPVGEDEFWSELMPGYNRFDVPWSVA